MLVECPASLHPLLRNCPGIDGCVATASEPPPFDVQAALLDLPALLGTTLRTVPATVPYLFPDSVLVEHWQRQLEPIRGFRVGVNWRCSPKNPTQQYRSARLEHFAPLARLPGVRLVSLQVGAGVEQLHEVRDLFSVVELAGPRDESTGAFMDTAAVMKSLDLVISIDTSVLHLAGALGVPVWAAIPFAPDWRWVVHYPDSSPWYPTMRLFRQRQWGNWHEVFERMTVALLRQREAGSVPCPNS